MTALEPTAAQIEELQRKLTAVRARIDKGRAVVKQSAEHAEELQPVMFGMGEPGHQKPSRRLRLRGRRCLSCVQPTLYERREPHIPNIEDVQRMAKMARKVVLEERRFTKRTGLSVTRTGMKVRLKVRGSEVELSRDDALFWASWIEEVCGITAGLIKALASEGDMDALPDQKTE